MTRNNVSQLQDALTKALKYTWTYLESFCFLCQDVRTQTKSTLLCYSPCFLFSILSFRDYPSPFSLMKLWLSFLKKKKNTEILKQMAHFLVCSSQTWCYSEYYFNLIIMFKKNHICKMTLENNYDLLHDDLQSDFTLKTVVTFHIYRLQMISTSGVLIF